MKYERSTTSGLEVMAKVKVFVHATDADADADDRALTAPRTYMSRLAKNQYILFSCTITGTLNDIKSNA